MVVLEKSPVWTVWIMHAEEGYLIEILVILAAAALCVPLANRFHLGSILGYLAAGAMIGPWGLGLVLEVGDIQKIAEFGVAFLLFVIGIEMKLSRLWLMRRQVFGLGGLQVLLTAAVLGGVAWCLGISPTMSIIVGLGLALSSTAMGLQILSDHGELATPHGRSSFAILLLQDLTVPLLFALVPLLSARHIDLTLSVGLAVLQSVAILLGVIFAGRFLLRPFLHVIARSRRAEVFTMTILLIVLGIGWVAEHVGFSMAMGAFLAGLLLADSEFRHQIEADITPFRGLLLGLFFMSVGMVIDFGLLKDNWARVLALVFGLLTIKAAILIPLARFWGLSWANATKVGFLLAQGGEFAFVLFSLSLSYNALDPALIHLLVLVVSLSMAMTPPLSSLSGYVVRHIKRQPSMKEDEKPLADVPEEENSYVIIAGFGRVGRTLAALLEESGQRYIAFDYDVDTVIFGRAKGYPVFFGDASKSEVIRAARAAKARLVVLTMDDPSSAARALGAIRHLHPELPIYCRTRDHDQSRELMKAGATCVIPETLETSLHLSRVVLNGIHMPEDKVEEMINLFRLDNYAKLQEKLGSSYKGGTS